MSRSGQASAAESPVPPPADVERRDDVERRAVAETLAWLEQVVVGLNLCPFASAVLLRRQVRCVATAAASDAELLARLGEELALLAAADPALIDTTLLVCTQALADFDDYNQFLDPADALLRAMDLEGVIQVASFHPRYRFADSDADDVTNATNRSPWPTLHLLREASVERAVAAIPDPAAIYEANMRTLQALGADGWERLRRRCLVPAR
jgi:hypothetical protein